MLDQWSAGFETFVQARCDALTQRELSGIGTLRIYRSVGFTFLYLKRTLEDDQMLWDEFCPMFDEIVNLAAVVLAADSDIPSRKPYFSLDLGIIAPLFEVARRC